MSSPKDSIIDEDGGYMVPKDLKKSIFDSPSRDEIILPSSAFGSVICNNDLKITYSNRTRHENKIINLDSDKKAKELDKELLEECDGDGKKVDLVKKEMLKLIFENDKKRPASERELIRRNNVYDVEGFKDRMGIRKNLLEKDNLKKSSSVLYGDCFTDDNLNTKETLYSYCIKRIFEVLPSKSLDLESKIHNHTKFNNKFISKVIIRKENGINKNLRDSMNFVKLFDDDRDLDFKKGKSVNVTHFDTGFMINSAVEIETSSNVNNSKRMILVNRMFSNEMVLYTFDSNGKETNKVSFLIPLPLEFKTNGVEADNYVLDFKTCYCKRKLYIIANSRLLGSSYYCLYSLNLRKFELSEELTRIKSFDNNKLSIYINISLYQVTSFKGDLYLLYSNTKDSKFYKVNFHVKDKEKNFRTILKELRNEIQSIDMLSLSDEMKYYLISSKHSTYAYDFDSDKLYRSFKFNYFSDENESITKVLFMKGYLFLCSNNSYYYKYNWSSGSLISTLNLKQLTLHPWSNGTCLALDKFTGHLYPYNVINTSKNKKPKSDVYTIPRSHILSFKMPIFHNSVSSSLYTVVTFCGNKIDLINIST